MRIRSQTSLGGGPWEGAQLDLHTRLDAKRRALERVGDQAKVLTPRIAQDGRRIDQPQGELIDARRRLVAEDVRLARRRVELDRVQQARRRETVRRLRLVCLRAECWRTASSRSAVLTDGLPMTTKRLRTARAAGCRAGPGRLLWPIDGTITSPFGPRWGRLHAGLDIGAPEGTPIKAADAGRVVLTGPRGRRPVHLRSALEHAEAPATRTNRGSPRPSAPRCRRGR